MSKVIVDKDKLDILANAISDKSGEEIPMTLAEMVEAVDEIDASGITPTGNIIIEHSGVTNVTEYATATVNQLSSLWLSIGYKYSTVSGQRKWEVTPKGGNSGSDGGFIDGFTYYNGNPIDFNAIPSNTTVTPTESSQTIGGANTMMEGAVTVSAIPSNYIGSGITARDASDATVSGRTVSVPEGYYEDGFSVNVSSGTEGTPTASKGSVSNHSISVTPSVTNTAGYISGGTKTGTAVSISASELVSGTLTISSSGTKDVTNYASASVSSGSATPASTISATGASVSTGTNTLTLSKSVSNTPTVSAGYISAGTAGNSDVSLTASVTTQGAQTIYPSTTDQTIASGRYLTGTQTISAVSQTNLTADNIKSGTTISISNGSTNIFSVLGTYAGGSSGVGTLLTTYSMGTISTSSTTATDTGKSISVSGVNNYDLLIVETSVNTVTNNRHTATVGLIFLTASSTVGTKNGAGVATMKWNSRISSQGVTTTRQGTTAYGIYPNSCSVATSNSVTTATIPMYQRYNSTSTGTINGSYTTRVYGVNLYDLIGG